MLLVSGMLSVIDINEGRLRILAETAKLQQVDNVITTIFMLISVYLLFHRLKHPPEVPAAEGAGLPVAGLTAHQALTQAAGVKLDASGQRSNILITAASGGVGLYAVQLAKLGNTYVTATCGARNINLVKSLGADEVLDYKTPDGAALKSSSGQKYDDIIHCAAGIPWSTFEPQLSSKGKVYE
ncbi:hypothetical protein POM88_026719 [Heracleum sosnowskyi]|uniref:Alcohol dehydrogenase-like C-terminal domain-containing protein n=1 Tax=Heracleum sosnowskyi TaxID=360622 RepID=A0AAD8I9N6_9APIA|nr:hypothetical protein POM88_026719 [Heracleum sosnowskyi]